jgi:hypothetical protein
VTKIPILFIFLAPSQYGGHGRPEMLTLEGRAGRQPELLLHLERVNTRVWCLPDLRFLIPKAYVYLKFRQVWPFSLLKNGEKCPNIPCKSVAK